MITNTFPLKRAFNILIHPRDKLSQFLNLKSWIYFFFFCIHKSLIFILILKACCSPKNETINAKATSKYSNLSTNVWVWQFRIWWWWYTHFNFQMKSFRTQNSSEFNSVLQWLMKGSNVLQCVFRSDLTLKSMLFAKLISIHISMVGADSFNMTFVLFQQLK